MAAGLYPVNATDASNTAFAGVNLGESVMLPSDVNNFDRALLGATKRWLQDIGAVTAVGGTASAITITLKEASYTGYGTSANQIPDGAIIGIETTSDATGATTLNVNSIGTKKVLHTTGAAIAAKDWVSGRFLLLRYDASADSAAGAWIILNDRAGGNAYFPSGGKLDFGSGAFTITNASSRGEIAGNLKFTSSGTGIIGTTTNDDAQAAITGEIISSGVALGSAVVCVTGSGAVDITSISLTAGDWDVSGDVAIATSPGGSTSTQRGWVNTTSATAPTIAATGGQFATLFSMGASATIEMPTGTRRLSLASTTTVYLGAQVTGSNSLAYGFIRARRVR